MNTLAGRMTVNTMAKLRDLRLPEFNKNMSIESQMALVFGTPCRYNIIFGSDFLSKVGTKINYVSMRIQYVVEWYDSRLPLQDPHGLAPKDFKEMEDSLYAQIEEELLGMIGLIPSQPLYWM